MNKLAHSYSSLKLYENCPLRYYRQRVKKDVVDKGGPASIAGDRIHKQLEDRIAHGTELPEETAHNEPLIRKLEKYKNWTLVAEQELALNKKLKPTGWWDEDAWFRGKIDVLLLNEDQTKAVVLDWKTGKRRPDMFQMEIFAAMVFAHYNSVQNVETTLVWLKDRAVDKLSVSRKERGFIWQEILKKVKRIEKSLEHDTWPAKPSGLCPYCPARPTCNYAY